MQAVRIVLSGRVTYLFGQDLRCRGNLSRIGPHRQLRAHREPRLSRAGGRRELVWRLVVNLHLLYVCEPFGTCNMFARICEADRKRFAAACRNVWDNQGMYIKNEIVEIETEA